jgi:MFS family permease
VNPTFQEHLDAAPLTRYQWRLWFLAAMGPLLDGFDFFIVGVTLPLIVHQFDLDPLGKGLVAVAALAGALVGSLTLGRLADDYGRRRLLLFNCVLFVVFAAASALAWNPISLIVFRFLLGVGIGADYPVGATYIAEIVPARVRARFLVGAMVFLTLGSILGVFVGMLILRSDPTPATWRWILAAGVIPAAMLLVARLRLPESPMWLITQGRFEQASRVTTRLTGTPIQLDESSANEPEPRVPYSYLFAPRYLRRTVFTAVPWALMDIVYYGVGLFTPTILAAIATGHHHNYIAADIDASMKTLLVQVPLLMGSGLALLLIVRVTRVRLQFTGFLAMSVGLVVAAASTFAPSGSMISLAVLLAGFAIFNLATTSGPGSTTYLLSGESFPTEMRGTGAGFAAGAGKAGALAGTLFLPVIIAHLGMTAVFVILAILCAFGALITKTFAVDTGADLA